MTKFIECIWVSLNGSDMVSNDLHDHVLVWPCALATNNQGLATLHSIKATTILIAKAAKKNLCKNHRNMISKSDNKTTCNANNNFFANFINNSH